uniref:Uncharacterized protein n=1 Tax=viral metagenome TaxID=1070528 RepID=A0A6M3X590_9ZZZZ
MSLEHIFRNLNDIRIFDLFSSCQFDKEHPIEIDEILELLEYPDREIIQIEDSIKHLVNEGILVEIYDEINTSTGCPICARLDGHGFLRPFEHEKHVAEIKTIIKIPCYYLDGNSKIGYYLTSAVIASNFRTTEELEEGK